MSPGVKFLIGLVAVVVMGWTYHGPVGNGEALVNRLEAQAQAAVAASEIPGVQIRLGRDPLSRAATLSGPANDFQREGMGGYPGLNGRVGAVEGISRIEWANPPPARSGGNS
jgi:OOP family OmpA-OmpF porin